MYILMKLIFIVGTIVILGCAATPKTFKETIEIIRDNPSPKSTIMLLHGCNGQQGYEWHSQARMIASWGYNVVMVDSFTKRGYRNICSNTDVVHPRERAQDVIETTKYILNQPWHKGKIGVIGYSHGGSVALNISTNPETSNISGVVAFYPSCASYVVGQNYWYAKVPLQIHIGDKDDWTPARSCMSESWATPKKSYELFVYKNTYHSFDRAGEPRTYLGHHLESNVESSNLANGRTREFFAKFLAD